MPTPAVVITGASAGIGEALARAFAARGHPLLIVARRADRLEALAAALRATHGVAVRTLTADLATPAAREAVAHALDATGWTLGVLVNNAGVGSTGPVHDTPIDRTLGMVHLNIEALTHLCALLAPRLVAQRAGAILNVASTAAFQAGPNMSVYCASKAYVLSFSEGLAHELAPHGVTVTCHCPGATASEFAEAAGNDVTPLFQLGFVSTADAVAADALRALDARRVVAVHGWLNAAAAQLTRVTPRAVLRAVAGWVLTPRRA